MDRPRSQTLGARTYKASRREDTLLSLLPAGEVGHLERWGKGGEGGKERERRRGWEADWVWGKERASERVGFLSEVWSWFGGSFDQPDRIARLEASGAEGFGSTSGFGSGGVGEHIGNPSGGIPATHDAEGSKSDLFALVVPPRPRLGSTLAGGTIPTRGQGTTSPAGAVSSPSGLCFLALGTRTWAPQRRRPGQWTRATKDRLPANYGTSE